MSTPLLRYKAVWLSDIHLGFRDCRADYLLDFLNSVDCETLYLVGDIVDLWSLKKRFFWPAAHYDVLRAILKKSRPCEQRGTRGATAKSAITAKSIIKPKGSKKRKNPKKSLFIIKNFFFHN